jgi:hypothetical protein
MSLGTLDFNDPGGALAITDDSTVSRSFSLTTFGLWARIKTLTIRFDGLSHTFPSDLDFLFVGPDGTNLVFWSDVGSGSDIFNKDFVISDSAAAVLPLGGSVPPGTYRPTDYVDVDVETNGNWTGLPPGLVINHPAPSGAATLDASFAGKWIDNTTWTLFVRDDFHVDTGTLNDWGIAGDIHGICKPHDFNGAFINSASDILWQNNDGTAGIWLMNGFTVLGASGVGTNPGRSWHVKGDADFDFDGKSDILWQNDDGTPGIWRMDGMTILNQGPVGTNPGAAWHIKGTGDFNFDGPADILWQHDDGTPGIWLMNGFTVLAAAPVGTNPGPSWQIKDSGDFNNDGRSDILWQNTDGTAGIWLMDGLNVLAASAVGTNPGPSWHITGSGDYDIDQRSDILWQHDSGQAGVWTMNGLSVVAAGTTGTNPGSDWHIIG